MAQKPNDEIKILFLTSSFSLFLPYEPEHADDIKAEEVTKDGRKGIKLYSKSGNLKLNVAVCKGTTKTDPWEIPIIHSPNPFLLKKAKAKKKVAKKK